MRQTDPDRGASPWKRGVRSGEQVLVCPDCQRTPDWTAALDACPRCGSTMLVRALGETQCRACGGVVETGPGSEPAAGGGAAAGLADEVAAALDRLFGSGRTP
jgi:ribosomal protein L37AE/L43A